MKHFCLVLSHIGVLLCCPFLNLFAQDSDPSLVARHTGGLFEQGYILQDRNNDSIVDYIDCAMILPGNPSEAEITGAANIAARLGYETTSLDFNLTRFDTEKVKYYDKPVILIGQGNKLLNKSGELKKISGINLKPGQGEICFFTGDGFFRKGGVLVSGYDATGLIAASAYFAGRYPDIWKPEGKTYRDLHKQFSRFLDDRNITTDEIFSSRIVVDAKKAGVKKLTLIIDFPGRANFDSAHHAFKKEEILPGKKEENNKNLGEGNRADRASLDFFGLHRIEVMLNCPDTTAVIDLLPPKEWDMSYTVSAAGATFPDFSLSDFYSIKGIFSDLNRDFIPDHVNAYISLNGSAPPMGLIHFTLRTGLETAGMKLPFVFPAGEEDYPEKAGFPLLYGGNHYSLKKLEKADLIRGVTPGPGIGYIQFIPEALHGKHAIVISGSDDAGLFSISDYISRRLPYLWDYGKGNYRLDEIENDVRKFFQVKNASGQAAVAIHKLNTWLDRISDKSVEAAEVELAVEETPEGLSPYLRDLVQNHFPDAEVKVSTHKTGYGNHRVIFEEMVDIPWEVDEFWKIFREEVLTGITSTDQWTIEVRVSESPEMRKKIKEQIISELRSKGIDPELFEITVLCAYKQGYSWLNDYILPKIKDRQIGHILISYHTLKDSREVRWQTVNANSRWLQEIFPIDTVMARELNISDSLITFRGRNEKDPIYTVTVTGPEGDTILNESFDPAYVIRPFFDLFPQYESVRVTTGWLKVTQGDRVVVDRRIKTDPEMIWDHLQTDTYRRIIDYFMDIQDGRPSGTNAPFFDELRIEITLSEPNYRIGIDEEVISSTEALHEDILFHTLALFNRIGGHYDAGALRYPGRILPLLKKPVDGKAGQAKITFTGKEKAIPELVFTYREPGGENVKQRYPLTALDVKPPLLRGIEVRSGQSAVNKLLFEVTATDSADRYEEHKLRGSEISIDLSFIAADKLVNMIRILGDLHEKGIYGKALSYDRINELLFRITLEDSIKFTRYATLKRGKDWLVTSQRSLPEVSNRIGNQPLVQWNTPIPPGEAARYLATLNKFPEINAYYMATSFLGHKVYAADICLPVEGKYISQAKLNGLKPSLMLIGRVHGNEVSSTSHQLRLAEYCATDTGYRNLLRKMNLIIYPVVNPDGAQTAYDMYMENPDFMLHAGRYGALGTDVGTRSSDPDELYPEATVVMRLRETWLPDVFVDMHGVPSHEWVQYFAGYSAWVNSRRGGARSYWLPRGWYIPGFSWIEDDKYPELMQVQKAITDSITSGVMSLPEVKAMNERFYDRYIKYGKQDPETYREYFHEGVQLEASLRNRKITESGITGPTVTYYSVITESADETAYGDWLRLVCQAGLANSKALMNYLSGGENRVKQETKEYDEYIVRSVFRKKPVLPVEKK